MSAVRDGGRILAKGWGASRSGVSAGYHGGPSITYRPSAPRPAAPPHPPATPKPPRNWHPLLGDQPVRKAEDEEMGGHPDWTTAAPPRKRRRRLGSKGRVVLPGARIGKASQLGLFASGGDDRKPVQHPGSRGGKYYVTRQGEIRYGDRPALSKPQGESLVGRDVTVVEGAYAGTVGRVVGATAQHLAVRTEAGEHILVPHAQAKEQMRLDQPTPRFDTRDVIATYTRAQAIDDGVLMDLTPWAHAGAMRGGWTIPIAATAKVWAKVTNIPRDLVEDVRGRAHDLLWMAAQAARRTPGSGTAHFRMLLNRNEGGKRLRNLDLQVQVHPGDHGEPVATIMLPDED